jgi:hypothetical protein
MADSGTKYQALTSFVAVMHGATVSVHEGDVLDVGQIEGPAAGLFVELTATPEQIQDARLAAGLLPAAES